MGVLIVKVWAVVLDVFLPHLSYQKGVLAECLLMASLCEEALSPAASNWGAPWEWPWTLPHQEARYLSDLVSDAVTWALAKAQVQYGQKGKKPWGWALFGKGMLLGGC